MWLCRLSVVLVLVVLLVQDGWGQTSQTDKRARRREKQRYRLAELARATTSFGVSMYRQLTSQTRDNVIFSPLSVFTALSMTLPGTRGSTKAQLRAVLAQRPRQGVHGALHAIFASFPSSQASNVTLRMGNAVYYDDTEVVLADRFSRTMRRYYGASPTAFARQDPEQPINDWVSRQTGGKIPEFLSVGEITPDTMLLLLNAIYFQGTWKDIFDERLTGNGDFTTASGSVVSVPMMFRDGSYSVKAVESGVNARAMELPYGTDGRFSMFILLPDEVNGLRDVEANIDSQVLEAAMTNMPAPRRHMVSVPKFSLRVKTSLKDILQSMGLTRIFGSSADLSRMASQAPAALRVDDVKHEAVIEVNERGTVAAAVTSVGIVPISLPPQFFVDRPFLLVLRDNKARLNLFMGRVNNPLQSQ